MLLMGKSTISMAIFNSFLYVHQRINTKIPSAFPSLVQISRMSHDLSMTWAPGAQRGVLHSPQSPRGSGEGGGSKQS